VRRPRDTEHLGKAANTTSKKAIISARVVGKRSDSAEDRPASAAASVKGARRRSRAGRSGHLVKIAFKCLTPWTVEAPDGSSYEFEEDGDISGAPAEFRKLLSALDRAPRKRIRQEVTQKMTCSGVPWMALDPEERRRFMDVEYLGYCGPGSFSMTADGYFSMKWVAAYARVTFVADLNGKQREEALHPLVFLPEFSWHYSGYSIEFYANPEYVVEISKLPSDIIATPMKRERVPRKANR